MSFDCKRDTGEEPLDYQLNGRLYQPGLDQVGDIFWQRINHRKHKYKAIHCYDWGRLLQHAQNDYVCVQSLAAGASKRSTRGKLLFEYLIVYVIPPGYGTSLHDLHDAMNDC